MESTCCFNHCLETSLSNDWDFRVINLCGLIVKYTFQCVLLSEMNCGEGETDITQLLRDTASQIPDGYFVAHSGFSLEASMRAIDILDIKVDSGIGLNTLLTIDERIQQSQSAFDR